jgi:addiction module HigA family antidote
MGKRQTWRSRITIEEENTKMATLLPPIHPGKTIKEDILKPLNMSVNQLAKALAVDASRLNEIVRGRRSITADTALRLARYLGTSAEFWIGLQLDYELRSARQARLREIERAVTPRSEAA